MTSHKYLSKKKGAAYTFFSGLRTAILPSVCIALLELLVFAIAPAFTLSEKKKSLGAASTEKLSDTIKFFTSIFEERFLCYAVLISVALLSITAAVILLRFMADKHTVNVYYSLGIKRRTLFLSRWFSGAVMLTVPPVLAVTAGFIVNLIYLKLSWQLSVAYLHIFLGMWIFSLLCFSVSAAVFSSVGTVSEGIFYSVGVLAFPSAVLLALQNLLTAFIPAATFKSQIRTFGTSGFFDSLTGQSLLTKFSRYNPVLFFADDLFAYSCGTVKQSQLLLADSTPFTFPNFGISLFWIPVAVIITVIGCVFFVRRNAEKCGFLNTNKVLANAVLFELIMAAVAIPLTEMNYYPLKDLFIGSAIAAFVIYILFEIFLKRNFKLIVKSCYKFAAHAAVIGIIIGIFSSGLFGYAKYVPDTSDVRAAAVAVPVSGSSLDVNSRSYMSTFYSMNPFIRANLQHGFSELPEMTGENDIKEVTALHKKLVDANTDSDGAIAVLTFRYVLKNGRNESRKVFVKSEKLLRETLGLCASAACKAQYEKLLGTDWSTLKNDSGKFIEYKDAAYGAFVYENSSVVFYPTTLNENYALDLEKTEFYALKDAVKKDLAALTAADMFDSTSKPLGVLTFSADAPEISVEGMTGVSQYMEPVSKQLPETVNENELPDDGTPEDETDEGEVLPEETEKNKKLRYGTDRMYEIFRDYGYTYTVIVTEKMTNTIAALKNSGLEEVFRSRLTPKTVSFIKLDFSSMESSYSIYGGGTFMSRDMLAFALSGENVYNYKTDSPMSLTEGVKTYTENIITDPAKISEVLSKVSLRSLAKNGDYICAVDFGDERVACYPLPSEKAPEYVKNYTYHITVDTELA